jgi:phospholipase/carboxylesterase
VASPQAPLTVPGWPGHHWYLVPRVGYPDARTFAASASQLAELHDGLWASTGIPPERTVLGGFSMGTVMSYALALDGARPAPGGILALSGFIPTVDGWSASLQDRGQLKAFIAHGRRDPTISVSFAQRARQLLEAAGLPVEYHETDAGHHVDPAYIPAAVDWLRGIGSSAR